MEMKILTTLVTACIVLAVTMFSACIEDPEPAPSGPPPAPTCGGEGTITIKFSTFYSTNAFRIDIYINDDFEDNVLTPGEVTFTVDVGEYDIDLVSDRTGKIIGEIRDLDITDCEEATVTVSC